MNSGKFWVLGLLALGAAAGLVAVTYWQRPENSVRWSFTQIHTSLHRGKKEAAARFFAPRMTLNGKDLSAAEFLAAYAPSEPADIATSSCPATPPHVLVTMKTRVFCFYEDGSIWRLHWVGTGACDCR